MIARRVVFFDSDDLDDIVDYLEAPYGDWDACNEIYDSIMVDFIDCYGEDLYLGSAGELSLFDSFASPDDEGLMWILSTFGKNYADFLLDAFFYYGDFLDEMCCPDDDSAVADPEELARDAEAHQVRKVLQHCTDATLTVCYPDDSMVYWEFANAEGKLWYRRADLDYVDGEDVECIDEYGCFDLDDPDGWGALHDSVLGLFANGDVEEWDEFGDPFGLIGINPDDLEDED